MLSQCIRKAWLFLAGIIFFKWRNARYIILIGGPGAGKGTQSDLLAPALGIPHLSMGDAFRRQIAAGTELGKQVESTVKSGALVSPELTMAVLSLELTPVGALLDGFPRTHEQAVLLDKLLFRRGNHVEKVILLEVPEADLIERLSLRRTCSNKSCGRTYHTKFAPPNKPDTCDACGSPLYQRPDDVPDSIRERLRVFREQSKPLCDYYQAKGLLTTVSSTNGMDKQQVFAAVLAVIQGKNRS